jgi:hypothetical protein
MEVGLEIAKHGKILREEIYHCFIVFMLGYPLRITLYFQSSFYLNKHGLDTESMTWRVEFKIGLHSSCNNGKLGESWTKERERRKETSFFRNWGICV